MTSGLPSEATWPRMIHPDPVTERPMVPVDCAAAAVPAIKADRSTASILAKWLREEWETRGVGEERRVGGQGQMSVVSWF